MMRQSIEISNSTDQPRTFALEPWSGEYDVPPRSRLRIEIEAPSMPVLELEFTDNMLLVLVHGPVGADATVYLGDVQVRAR